MEDNAISAEVYTLNSIGVDHIINLYPDGQREIYINKTEIDLKSTVDFLELSGFKIKSKTETKSQIKIEF